MTDNKTIQIISFDGSALSWPDWEIKFLARAQRKGFAGILKGTAIAPLVSMVINEMTATGKEEKKKCNSNNYAYEESLLLIQTKTNEGQVAFRLVTGSISMDLPDGNAAAAWTRLKNKYVPIIAEKTGVVKRIPEEQVGEQ